MEDAIRHEKLVNSSAKAIEPSVKKPVPLKKKVGDSPIVRQILATPQGPYTVAVHAPQWNHPSCISVVTVSKTLG